MTPAFTAAWAQLVGNEGGYANNPSDPGGETMWGITERVARKHGYPGAMIDLPKADAEQIAHDEYWEPHGCDGLPPIIAFQVLDAAYNGGYPGQWLQMALGVTVDGVVGPATQAAAAAADPYRVLLGFNSLRLRYFTSLPTWLTFGRGWANRIADNLHRGAET